MTDKWRPIETAPEGVPVLVACKIAKYDWAGKGEIEGGVCKAQKGTYGWFATDTCYYSVDPINPTHWMPLPEPPEEMELE